jgi:putative flippase GtrA
MSTHAAVRTSLPRFAVVGVLSTALYAGVYAWLTAAGTHYLVAVAVAYAAGIAFGFVAQGRWAFGHDRSDVRRLPLYTAIQVSGMLAALGLIASLVEGGGLDPIVAQIIVYPLVSVAGYGAHRRWTFRHGP